MAVETTHVGSLPRSQEVVDFIFAREQGKDYDQAAFDAAMTSAVAATVARQKDAGVSIVSDGETSKISYATYVKDRYTGFDGDSPRNAPLTSSCSPPSSSASPTTAARRPTPGPCAWAKSAPRARTS